jgi:hypothetical protein
MGMRLRIGVRDARFSPLVALASRVGVLVDHRARDVAVHYLLGRLAKWYFYAATLTAGTIVLALLPS